MQDDDFNINVKELLAIIVALRLWGPQLAVSRLLLKSDNCAAVQAINNRRSRAPFRGGFKQVQKVRTNLSNNSDYNYLMY